METKNAKLGAQSKANHLSYLGDADIGERVNIGAGTITCNYDGANKHQTQIGDDVFVGSDTQLIAPISIGRGATIGAGSTLTQSVAPEQLVLTRAATRKVEQWRRPKRKNDYKSIEKIAFCCFLYRTDEIAIKRTFGGLTL